MCPGGLAGGRFIAKRCSHALPVTPVLVVLMSSSASLIPNEEAHGVGGLDWLQPAGVGPASPGDLADPGFTAARSPRPASIGSRRIAHAAAPSTS